jgi:hypothetical protein
MSKRDYVISRRAGATMWTCEVTDSYGETHTNYFETERRCREHIYYTWENEKDPLAKERAEHWRDDLLYKAIEDCIKMDKEAGITSENNDCLD